MTNRFDTRILALDHFGQRHERTGMRLTLLTLLLIVLAYGRIDRQVIDAVTGMEGLVWGLWVVVGILADRIRHRQE